MDVDLDNGKRALHQLIDQLPTDQVRAALQYVHYLCADPVLLSLLNAPSDDEPYTEGNVSATRRQRHQLPGVTAFRTRKSSANSVFSHLSGFRSFARFEHVPRAGVPLISRIL
jgi:hypothetical protein